jgi:hypothetical protein
MILAAVNVPDTIVRFQPVNESLTKSGGVRLAAARPEEEGAAYGQRQEEKISPHLPSPHEAYQRNSNENPKSNQAQANEGRPPRQKNDQPEQTRAAEKQNEPGPHRVLSSRKISIMPVTSQASVIVCHGSVAR